MASTNHLKKFIKAIFLLPLIFFHFLSIAYGKILNIIRPNLSSTFFDYVASNQATTQIVRHQSKSSAVSLKVYTPNSLCKYRADTFSTKEPETLAWIDKFGGDGPLFDIGANIGLYSLYYAATKTGNVYCFEPSFLNLKLLAKNIHANKLGHKIRIIPNPLTDHNQFANFSLSSIQEGGALSSFGVNYGHDGKELDTIFSYTTLGLTLDHLLSYQLIPETPQLIKIDVDGIEHLILAGAVKALQNPNLKSILIEVNDNFRLQALNVDKFLTSSGFYLIEKQSSEIIAVDKFSGTFNQIWSRLY